MNNIYESELHRLDPFLVCEAGVDETFTLTFENSYGSRQKQVTHKDDHKWDQTTKVEFTYKSDNYGQYVSQKVELFSGLLRQPRSTMLLDSNNPFLKAVLQLLKTGQEMPCTITWQSGFRRVFAGALSPTQLFQKLLKVQPCSLYPEITGVNDIYVSGGGEAVEVLDGIPFDVSHNQGAAVSQAVSALRSARHPGPTSSRVEIGGVGYDIEEDEHGEFQVGDSYGFTSVSAVWTESYPAIVQSSVNILKIERGYGRCFKALPFGEHNGRTIWLIGVPVVVTGPDHQFMQFPGLHMAVDGVGFEQAGPPYWDANISNPPCPEGHHEATAITLLMIDEIEEGWE